MENKTEKPDTDTDTDSEDDMTDVEAETIDIEENQATGEVIATTTHVVKGEDGSTSTIRTKEKFKNGKFGISPYKPSIVNNFLQVKYKKKLSVLLSL